MDKFIISAVAASCAIALTATSFAPPVRANPSVSATETCDLDDPTPCMKRHGEGAAHRLIATYKDVAKLVDQTCNEVIGAGTGDCLSYAQAVADKELHATFTRAMNSIDTDGDGRKWRGLLKHAQENWLRFRDSDCGDLVVLELYKGTGAGPASSLCSVDHTIARSAELRRRYGL